MQYEKTQTVKDELQVTALFQQALGLHQQGKLQEAEFLYLAVIDQDQKHLNAWNNLGAISLQVNDLDCAEKRLRHALTLNPTDSGTRHNLSCIMAKRGEASLALGDIVFGMNAFRESLCLNSENHGARIELENLLNLSGQRAMLSDFTNELTDADLNQVVLIACMPKSGSTMMRRALELLTGAPDGLATRSFLQNEQELDRLALLELVRRPHVVQQHIRATDPNIFLLQGFKIDPIILVRNLFDIIVSLDDFYQGGAMNNTFFKLELKNAERSKRFDLIIDMVMPWYVQFYVSWVRAIAEGVVRGMMVTYEEMQSDKTGLLKKISDFYGLGKNAADIEQVVRRLAGEKNKTRFNKGVTGRGQDCLSEVQKHRMKSYARHFKDIDFTPIL